MLVPVVMVHYMGFFHTPYMIVELVVLLNLHVFFALYLNILICWHNYAIDCMKLWNPCSDWTCCNWFSFLLFFALYSNYDLYYWLQIGILLLAQVCSLCNTAKLFTWLVSNLFFNSHATSTADLKLLYIWFEGYSRLPSFLAFACKSKRHCGLIKRYIQGRHAQGIHNVQGDKNYKVYMSLEYFDAHITPLGWQQVSSSHYVWIYVCRHVLNLTIQVMLLFVIQSRKFVLMKGILYEALLLVMLQVDNLRKHVHECGLAKRIDLVIASPLLR